MELRRRLVHGLTFLFTPEKSLWTLFSQQNQAVFVNRKYYK
jgi:hypothetical protein